MSGEYYTDRHPLSARARAEQRKVVRSRKANLREDALGKINWECYEHRQLWDMIKSAEPPKLGERAYDWARLAKEIDTETAAVREIVQRLVLSWRGPSAAQAAESAHLLTTWASDAAQTSRQIGDGLDAYTSAITEARRKMPEPVHYTAERWFKQGYAVKALDGPNGAYMMDDLLDDKLPTKQEADRAKAEAVRVMEQYEDASRGVRHALPPLFAAAPKAADVQAPVGPPTVVPPSDPEPPRIVPPPVETGPDPRPPVRTPDSPVVPDPGTANHEDGTYAASAGIGDFPAGATTGSTGPGQGAGYGTGLSAPGGGFAAEDAARSGRGAAGGFAGGFGQGAAAARGGAGSAGFGMYPPMTGTQREEDKEHRDRYGSGYDLLDDLPPAYPPVFGE
ncbi:PPE domain-containing protein [Amycolatopsis sp. NPDC089917]|uniref:PPE domain-containing protein n=1 Tax=Amycolatopsis sp. NPDC089917 TaxID=3155187 RepID=UPI00342DBCA4